MNSNICYSIITVNYGNSEQIKILWESLLEKSPKENFEFIVVDNNSPHGDGEILSEFFATKPQVHVLELKKNIGFGGGYHEGVKFAKGAFLGIINPDIVLKSGTLEKLKETLEQDENIGIVAPKLLNPNETIQQSLRKFPSPWVMFGRRLSFKFNKAYDYDPAWYESVNPVSVDWAQGSFLFLRTQFFTEELQGFDPRFFLFLEDTDLCRRSWEKGKKVVFVPEAIAYHGEKRLSGNNFVQAMWKKTFWIHIVSSLKYFAKYTFKKTPKIQSL